MLCEHIEAESRYNTKMENISEFFFNGGDKTAFYETFNLLIVWSGLFLLLKDPFIQSTKNYITNEKSQQASVEESFFKAKTRESENLSLMARVEKFTQFVDETRSKISATQLDEFSSHNSTLELKIEDSLTMESELRQTI